MTKQKSLKKNLKKLRTTHLMQRCCGGHRSNFLFFAKPAIQNPNIQPGVFLAKVKDKQSMTFFIHCHLMNF